MSPYHERTYRRLSTGTGLVSCTVTVRESDLFISGDRDLSDPARRSLLKHRRIIEQYGREHPDFFSSLVPLREESALAPGIVKTMMDASRSAGVGPMASVAGALAEKVSRDLNGFSRTVIVENGGDVFLILEKGEARVSIFAGPSPLSCNVNLVLAAGKTPCAVCTSSATVGPSLSFGNADAVCVVAASGALADAVATALANRVQDKHDIRRVLTEAKEIDGVRGVVIIVGDALGAWGDVTLE
ncbi:MAG: UPF0280 family protein [Syntrophales bacterium]|jgi:ApbE superfamily uncharacterized protein (UPF0280 family)|nr:UPF0280 family protein [Syntrophales bacterium]MCK9527244.1 UPF0280 family protein [Syntrophales bacterium]MDX9921286.1 UPF0280 family protein [Syntrophales bacterium]